MNWYFLIERHLQLEIYFSLSEQHHQHCATILNHILESICLTEEKHINQEGEGAITKVEREGFAESGNGNQMLLLLCHSWTYQHNADKLLKTCTIT